jgi:hypothetical protein
MLKPEVAEALEQIERELQFPPPIGATEIPPGIRYFRVLATLRERICPKAREVADLSKKSEGEVVAILIDCLISSLGGIPLPVATLSKHIAAIGVERFCADPNTILS